MTVITKAKAPSVARAASWGSAAFLFTIVITFFQTPFILDALGDARYGTWALIGEVTGYYGLLDLGTRGAISHFVSRTLATNDFDRLNRFVSSGFTVLSGVGIVALLGGAALIYAFPTLFELNGVPIVEVQGALIVAVIVVALTLPFDVTAAVLVGCRRPEVGSVADTVVRLLTFGAIIVVLERGGGLLALALIQLAGRAITWVFLSVQAWRYVPELRISVRLADMTFVRELFSYGSRTAVVALSSTVINRIDVAVIGAFLGVRYVTVYVLAQSVLRYVSNFVSVVTRSFTAHFAHHHARQDSQALDALYLRGSRLASAMACTLGAFVTAFGAPFLTLWVGAQYATGDLAMRADVIMIILLVGKLPRMLQSITYQLLFGIRRHGSLAKLQFVEAAANVILSLILVQRFGLPGIALGTVLPMLVTNLWRLPSLAMRNLDFGWGTYLRQGVGPGVLLGLGTLALGLLVRSQVSIDSWVVLLSSGAAVGSVAAVVAWLLVLNQAERAQLTARIAALRS